MIARAATFAIALASLSSCSRAARPLLLEPERGDVWAWEVEMRAEPVTRGAELSTCDVHVNGAAAPSSIERGRLRARVRLAPGDNRIDASCVDARGDRHRAAPSALRALLPVKTRAPLRVERGGEPIEDAVVYGVAPARYGSEPLRGVTRALPAIRELGADVIWLAPVMATIPGDYGYAVTDYFQVRADYGTDADLTALVAEAHRLGLRVLLDLVPNHTSAKHRYFEQATALGTRSHQAGFYAWDERGLPTHYFDWSHLPNLDYRNPEVGRFMIEASLHWVRRHGVDGFRVDAAWGIRDRAPAYWSTWTEEVRRERPAAMLIAEASARDPFYGEHGFDAAYDWTAEPGKWAWETVFDDPAEAPSRLDRALESTRASARGGGVLRFLENNDTGPRFITRHGLGVTRVAAAALLTLPGVPCLFTGQEVGAEYEPYTATTAASSADNQGLRAWYQTLLRLRHARPSLRSGDVVRLHAARGDPVYAYRRTDPRSGESTIVVLNFSDAARKVSFEVDAPRWRDLLTERASRDRGGRLQVRLGPHAIAVLAPEP